MFLLLKGADSIPDNSSSFIPGISPILSGSSGVKLAFPISPLGKEWSIGLLDERACHACISGNRIKKTDKNLDHKILF